MRRWQRFLSKTQEFSCFKKFIERHFAGYLCRIYHKFDFPLSPLQTLWLDRSHGETKVTEMAPDLTESICKTPTQQMPAAKNKLSLDL